MKILRHKQRGAVIILVAVGLVALIGFVALVVDLGNLYVRKSELQNGADAAALSGAREIDGTVTGLKKAQDAAIATAKLNGAGFERMQVTLSDTNISFASTPDGDPQCPNNWCKYDSGMNGATAVRLSYIKVDTTGATDANNSLGVISTWFARVLAGGFQNISTRGYAVAGKSLCEGLPIFTCALNPGAAPFGFELGRSYRLTAKDSCDFDQNIGPGNIGWMDPLPVDSGTPHITGANDMRDVLCRGQFYCYDKTGATSLTQAAFAPMARALNTRFGDYNGMPNKNDAENACPADTNVKEYKYNDAGTVNWMNFPPPYPANPDVQSEDDGGLLGVHWSGVRPAPADSGKVNGNYPADIPDTARTPYEQRSGSHYADPTQAPVNAKVVADNRRILTIAITDCSTPINGSGKPVSILGFGRFLMQRTAMGAGGGGGGCPSAKGFYGEFMGWSDADPPSYPNIKLFR